MVLTLEQFQRPQFQGYIENVPLQRTYPLRRLMPVQPTDDIQFSYNVINGVYAKAASITGWNASAPLRDQKDFETAFSEVAKIQHGVRLDEKQLLMFNKPRSDAERNRVIDYVYTTADELSMGVDDTEEFLRAQVLYNGVLNYIDDENDIKLYIDFGVPAENKLESVNGWELPTSEPLSDLQAAVAQFQKTNQRRKPAEMHMTSATEAMLLQNNQVRLQILGTTDGRIVTQNDLRTLFTALGLPPYVINDDVIATADGEKQYLDDAKVVLLGSNLGKTMVGPTVENNYNPGKFVQPIIKNDPPEQTVIVGEAAFPALEQRNAIVILNT